MIQPGTVLIGIENDSVANWLRWADNDYIAARQLLLDNLLVQGAALADTAIEKYFELVADDLSCFPTRSAATLASKYSSASVCEGEENPEAPRVFRSTSLGPALGRCEQTQR